MAAVAVEPKNRTRLLTYTGIVSGLSNLAYKTGLSKIFSRGRHPSNSSGGKKTQKRNLKLSTSTSRKRNNGRKLTHSRLPHKLKVSHKKIARKYKSIA